MTKLAASNNASCPRLVVKEKMKSQAEIEKSIIKKYRKQLWTPFVQGVISYQMVQAGDKIAVCISGGKDSLLLAKCMQELHRYSPIKFDLEFIAMNPGFSEDNYQLLIKTCTNLGINVKVFDTNIFAVVDKIANKFPCYMCARMRRGSLYDFAKQLGCNKIALGHHFDDFIETTMLNVLYAGNYRTMMPKLFAKNYENMQLIRPLVNVREADIIKYTKNNGIPVMNCGCTVAAQKTSSKRAAVKKLLQTLRQDDPLIDKSIFASAKNVNLTSILGWQDHTGDHHFLDEYENVKEGE